MLNMLETFVLNRMVDTKELNKDLDSISKSFTVTTLLQCGLDVLKVHLRNNRKPIKF
jgi:hypothetical protein